MNYGLIIGICWLALLVAWAILGMVFGSAGRRRDRSAAAIGVRLVVLASLFVGFRYGNWAQIRPFGDLALHVATAGVALCVAGLAGAIWARVALGRSWGMPMSVHDDPELVTSGPYRYVRHPIYTAMTVMLIGTSLVYPFAALPSVVVIAHMVFSAVREERDMEQRFPEAYRDYKRRSKMLVPFVL